MKSGPNIVLIGMPGSGKSTVGVLLAKLLLREFIDTDLLIQTRENRRLSDLLAAGGLEAFLRVEERYLLDLQVCHAVIATGGSAVYSEPAMQHLRAGGRLVFLDAPLTVLQNRLGDWSARGVVCRPGQTLAELHAERAPLYRRQAEITLDCGARSQAEVAVDVRMALEGIGVA